MYQDHEAHIAVHNNMMQDPSIAAAIGQNPQAGPLMAALQAHIAEHLGFLYRRQVQEAVGTPLPGPDEKLPKEMEVQISKMVAEGSQIVLAQNQQKAAQQQALQNAQDPIMQAELQKLQIQQAEVQRKMQKDQMDAQIEQARLALEQQKMQADMQIDTARLAAQVQRDQAQQEIDGLKFGIELNKGQQ